MACISWRGAGSCEGIVLLRACLYSICDNSSECCVQLSEREWRGEATNKHAGRCRCNALFGQSCSNRPLQQTVTSVTRHSLRASRRVPLQPGEALWHVSASCSGSSRQRCWSRRRGLDSQAKVFVLACRVPATAFQMSSLHRCLTLESVDRLVCKGNKVEYGGDRLRHLKWVQTRRSTRRWMLRSVWQTYGVVSRLC